MRQTAVAERKGLQNYAQVRIAARKVAQAPPKPIDLKGRTVPRAVVELVPESVARDNLVMPIEVNGETISLATHRWDDIALADKLRFLLAMNVELVNANKEKVERAINRHYGQIEGESADSMLQEFCDATQSVALAAPTTTSEVLRRARANVQPIFGAARSFPRTANFKRGLDDETLHPPFHVEGHGMFTYVVEEGERILVHRPNGKMDVLIGPQRVWRGRNRFTKMQHYVAHPGEFLAVRMRNGRQEHLPAPAELWFDPREHHTVEVREAMQVAAKEAVVIYSQPKQGGAVHRRIVHGPALFMTEPGEWLHTFSWHSSDGGSRGAQKSPRGLVFQKLWLMPDQMYHDVADVRTGDDAVLTIRLMIFFELVDIEKMLDTTHDPIGDFVNAATSDVVEFTGKHDFDAFKRNTNKLNELETYKQLLHRASQCGYKINNVVYRGYGAAASLQQMHDQAIEARTKLQLDRDTERQSQDLENYKLDCQLQRAGKRRQEQTAEIEHDLEIAAKRHQAELAAAGAKQAFLREQEALQAQQQLEFRRLEDGRQQAQLAELKNLGVELTSYLTQSRADRIIELRGGGGAHLHLDRLIENGKEAS